MPMIKCSLLYARPPRKLKIKQVNEQNGFDVYNEEERGDFTFIEAREL
jgi:hypothetical protein